MENRCSACGGKVLYDILKKCLVCESCGTHFNVDGLEKMESKLFYYPFNFSEAKIRSNFESRVSVEKVYEPYIYIQAKGQVTYQKKGEKTYYTKNFCSDVVSPKSKYMLGSMYRFLEDYDLIEAIPIAKEEILSEKINKDFDKDKFIKDMAELKLEKKIDISKGFFSYDSFIEKTLYVPIFYVKNESGQIIYVINGFTGRIIEESWINPKGFFSQTGYGCMVPVFLLILLILFILLSL